MRLGLAFDGTLPVGVMLDLARAAEQAGMHSLWVAEDFFYRDSVSVAAALLAATRRTQVAAFLSPYTRHPGIAAMTLAALDELGGGRAAAIVGTGNPLGLSQLGIDMAQPLRRTEEFIAVVRRLLEGERLDFTGTCFRTQGLALSFRPPRQHVPIYVAAMRPHMMALAARMADGIVLTAGASPEYVRAVCRWLGGQERPHPHAPFEVVGFVLTQVTEHAGDAAEEARRLLGYLLRNRGMAEVIRHTGLPVDQEAFQEAYRRDGLEAVGRMVTDDILHAFAVVGPPDACRRQLVRYLEAGLTLPVLMPVGPEGALQRAVELVRSA